ncbi:MAG: D-alanyl-D-alanine carboxypeptidase [Lachnospiraceae bacterium]|nr:D-alanyl-D-alanine carboxypeptidase [Lachnospiraceae bacterium]
MDEFRLDDLIDEEEEAYEEQRRLERRRRRMEMRRLKERQKKIRRIMKIAVPCVLILLGLLIGKLVLTNKEPEKVEYEPAKVYTPGQGDLEAEKQALSESLSEETGVNDAGLLIDGATETQQDNPNESSSAASSVIQSPEGGYKAVATDKTVAVEGEVVSSYAILVDTQTGEIIAHRNPKTIINPASMTKVLTVLVAAEHVTDLEDTFTITQEITDYSYRNDCSVVGWEVGEVVTVKDLFYGTVLPSGGDAAVALAEYVAGSHEAFVELMNAKLEEMGLSSTAHFTNCVGLYDENHYCTVYDMAMILQAALDNPICREALSAKKYTTTFTEQHPEGLLISNWFLRRIEDKDAGGFVLAGKTGYVVESGSCAASCALDENENEYICVTADSTSSWRCIYDHVEIYKTFLPQSESAESVSE